MTFNQWLVAADDACLSIAGVSLHDLSDGSSRDAFDDGCPPSVYAEDLLEENGWEG